MILEIHRVFWYIYWKIQARRWSFYWKSRVEFIISSGNLHLHLKNNKIDWKSEIFSGNRQFVLKIQVSCQNIYWKIQVKWGNLEWKSMWHQRKCSGSPVVLCKRCTDIFCNCPMPPLYARTSFSNNQSRHLNKGHPQLHWIIILLDAENQHKHPSDLGKSYDQVDKNTPFRKKKMLHKLSCLERGSSCCAVDILLHGSLNLAFRQCKLRNIFISGVVYWIEPDGGLTLFGLGCFPTWKDWGGQNGPLLTWLFKSDDDETWYGHTMSGDLFKLVKNLMTSLSFQCYDVIVILKCRDSQKVEGSCSSFVFLWIKLNIGVGGNFGPLISNLSSKTSYEYKFLGKKQFSSLQSCFLARYSLIDWLPSQQIITYS